MQTCNCCAKTRLSELLRIFFFCSTRRRRPGLESHLDGSDTQKTLPRYAPGRTAAPLLPPAPCFHAPCGPSDVVDKELTEEEEEMLEQFEDYDEESPMGY